MAEPRTILGPSNLVQVGTLISIVIGVAGGAVWVTKLDGRLSNLEADVREIKDRDESYLSDATFRLWIDAFEARNPGLVIPRFSK